MLGFAIVEEPWSDAQVEGFTCRVREWKKQLGCLIAMWTIDRNSIV
jgi:hypothetical protein